MFKLVVYIRGGLGDVWPAVSALKPIIELNKINKWDILIISDSVYYFRDYPKELMNYSLQMLHKISPNIIIVSPLINDNFWLNKNGELFDDTTEELSQEEANKYMNEFMFWRPKNLKEFVGGFVEVKTFFVDCLFTECIMYWNAIEQKYERFGNERGVFEFNPSEIEKSNIDCMFKLYNKHILINVRKKKEGNAHTTSDDFYQKIINWCEKKNIIPILIGIEGDKYEGKYLEWRGSNIFSFEGMAYLIDRSKVMLGNDSGFTAIKLYQQQLNTLTIVEHPRWERRWYFPPLEGKSKYLLLDAREDNFEKITKSIEEYYNAK